MNADDRGRPARALPIVDADSNDADSTDADSTGERFSVAASRALDHHTISEHEVPGLILMEHASIGIAWECRARLGEPAPSSPPRIDLYCGPGNNGGDGIACARHLFNLGLDVLIWELVASREGGSDAERQRRIARRMEIPIVDASSRLPAERDPPALRVDAIFGTGLSRPADGVFRAAIERLNDRTAPVVAVDVPSGLDADRGVPLGPTVEATVTVTLGLPKRGFLAKGVERFTGELRCVPIGASRRLLPGGLPAFPPVPRRLTGAGDRFLVHEDPPTP